MIKNDERLILMEIRMLMVMLMVILIFISVNDDVNYIDIDDFIENFYVGNLFLYFL